MKKTIFIMLAVASFTIGANAQTTTAKPISNGCGSEQSELSQVGAAIAKPVDVQRTNTSTKVQNASCDQHDKDYYNGVDRKVANDNFEKRSPNMGAAVKYFDSKSQKSYNEAQQDKQTSEKLQPTWEQEHKQSLDKENYKVQPRGY